MEVIKTIRPGRDGSKRLLEAYGDRLICVRYRKDTENRRNLVTVELIVDQIPQPRLTPPPQDLTDSMEDRTVYLEIAHFERDLHDRIRKHGGRWDPAKRRWYLGYRAVRALKLHHRIDTKMSFGWSRNKLK